MEKFTGIGSNSIILPNVTISEGAVVGALSMVPTNSILKPWTIYAGVPAKSVGKRNKEKILKQFKEYQKLQP